MRLGLLLALFGCNTTVCWFGECVDEPLAPAQVLDCSPSVDWHTVAQPFLNTWCTSCHASTLPAGERMGAPLGMDFDTWEGATLWSDRIAAVTQGRNPSMPPAGGPSQQERADIAAWVDCGAPGAPSETAFCERPDLLDGDLTIASPADREALCAGGRGLKISGELHVLAPSDAMPSCLCEISGDLSVEGLTAQGIDGSQLHTVGGDVSLMDNHGVRDIVFPELKHIGGSLSLERNEASQRVDFPRLETIGNHLWVQTRGSGGGFHAPWLASVAGQLHVEDNPQLLRLEFLRLASIGMSLRIDNNPSLADIGTLDTLVNVGGDLVLARLALPSFSGLRYVERIDGNLVVTDHDYLKTLDLLHVLETVGSVQLERLPHLHTLIGLHQLFGVEGDLNLIELDLEDTRALENIRHISGAITVQSMPRLRVLELSAQTVAGGLRIQYNDALEGIANWPLLEQLGNLRVDHNPVLRHIDGLQQVAAVDGELAILHNARLADLNGLVSLATVGGSLSLRNNDALESIAGLYGVQTIAGDLVITDNAALSLEAVEMLLEALGDDGVTGDIVLRGAGDTTADSEESDSGLTSG